jgi:hypothetical protein
MFVLQFRPLSDRLSMTLKPAMSISRVTFAFLFSIITLSLASAADTAVPIAYPAWNGCGNCASRAVYPALPVPPDTVWAPATDYPYVPGFARPYYVGYAFHDPAYMNPRYQHVPHWRLHRRTIVYLTRD